MRPEKKVSRVLQVACKFQVKKTTFEKSSYQATLQFASVCISLKRPASPETRVLRCQKLQKVPRVNSIPLKMSFQMLPCNCIYYYYATAYNTPKTQNYDCLSYDIRSNPK